MKGVYKLKLRPNGEIAKYKARLVVARGFMQKPGIEFMKSMHLLQDWKPS